jgi:hypothetical protein
MKQFGLLMMLVFLHLMLHAQEQPRANNEMKAGLRGAVAYSNMYGSKNYHSQPTGIGFSLGREEYLLGYSAGGWISNQITRTISIVGELNITRKGMTTPIVGVYNGSKYEITLEPQLTYLCAPFLVQYNPAKLNRLGLYAGFEPSLLLSAKQKISGNFDEGKTNIRKEFRSFDLGIVGGINYQFTPRIFIDFRMVNGIRDISRANEYTFATNKSAQLGLMYRLK